MGNAVLFVMLTPATEADRERLAHGVGVLMAEDPAMSMKTDAATSDVIIFGMGELHLEVIVERLKREFNVDATVSAPRVAYRVTVTCQADGDGRYVRQAAGRGDYAHVKVRLYPGEQGSGYVFENELAGGAIPSQFIKPVEEGIQDAVTRGVVASYPMDDVRIVLYDGSYHDADSSEIAFKIAAAVALKDAVKYAKPVLLEPVMRVEVLVPQEHAADVMANLSGRRGEIESHEESDGMQRIAAKVPLAEMIGYAADLHSRTRGRGTFAMQFAGYQRFDPSESPGPGDNSMVGAPRKPTPTLRASSVALPEPLDDEFGS